MEKLVLAQQGNASALPVSTTPLISSNTSSTNASGFTTPVSTVSSVSQSQDPQLSNTVQQSIMPLTSPIGDDPEGVNQETNAGFDLLKRQLSQASHLLQRQFQCKCQCRTSRQTIHLSFGMQHIITTGAWAGWSRMV
ncbi:hypothetical protein BGZ89_010146 [Linnemannia elongata]|nr:hypothetical protein BGZ89_010146 [Linnemannia elongata]